ncbi:hypothetical protein NC651_019103 [Populus alba x Populus x berolinensis]|nr:hypothetical protein NC651_019103 [Populus alba x Populus x berolinensis]
MKKEESTIVNNKDSPPHKHQYQDSRLPAQFLSLRAVSPAQERKLQPRSPEVGAIWQTRAFSKQATSPCYIHSFVQQCGNSFRPLRQSLRFPSHSFLLRSPWTLRTLLIPDLCSRYRTMLT